MALTLIGLGMSEGDISLAAAERIRAAETVIVKTRLNESYAFFEKNGIETISLDRLFEGCRSFDTLCEKIARRVYSLSRGKETVYCVEGSVSEDNACKLILARHHKTRVIAGVSKVSSAIELAGVTGGYTSLSAYDIKDADIFGGTLCVYDIDSAVLAGEVKLRLMEVYGDECPCTVICGDNVRNRPLFELDRLERYDYSTRAVIKPRSYIERDAYTFYDLVRIMEILRGEGGCPWDKAQTHKSIRTNAIEETYELVDAIDREDDERLTEELGDVLMQVVFHTEMGEERGALTLSDVTTGICRKLISRHSHIFFGDSAKDADEALDVWEKNKGKEHGFTAKQAVLDVPNCFPALMRMQKLQKRALKAGLDDCTASEAAARIGELAARLVSSEKDELMRDSGDFLFECVRLLRLKKVDAEMALADRSKQFADSFRDEDEN